MKYLYDLINAKTNKLDYKCVACGKAADILGIDKKAISWYANIAKKPLNGYHIVAVPYNAKLLEVEKEHQYRFIVNEVGKKVMLPLDLEKRWNDTVKAASILKNGGYRVLINGKPHHVEGRR